MVEYRAIFKCRLCGEIYESGCTGCKDIALQSVVSVCLPNANPPCPQSPSITEPHSCKDRSIGVADFQGFRKVNDDE